MMFFLNFILCQKCFYCIQCFYFFFAHENMKKSASKVAKPAQIQPKSQFMFHKNLPTRDFSIMTLSTGELAGASVEISSLYLNESMKCTNIKWPKCIEENVDYISGIFIIGVSNRHARTPSLRKASSFLQIRRGNFQNGLFRH